MNTKIQTGNYPILVANFYEVKFNQHVVKSGDSIQEKVDIDPDLILIFGGRNSIEHFDYKTLGSLYPKSVITGCSTSGTIAKNQIYDDELVINYIEFEKTTIRHKSCSLSHADASSYNVGKNIAQSLQSEELKHFFILSDGLSINGTSLIQGITHVCSDKVSSSGGLAGDADAFEKTLVINPDTLTAQEKIVVGLGFYGDFIQVGFGCKGGWEPFGILRTVTKSRDNVVYEIDNQPALELYKSYLGEKAEELPASALLFPLNMDTADHSNSVVRTILSVDENEQSMTFAGDIPMGCTVRLMKSNSDKLIHGAMEAAQESAQILQNPELAILISCVGRRLVLKQLAEEEVEAVQNELNARLVTGFYSYGEIAPTGTTHTCELHNQTMTITTFREL